MTAPAQGGIPAGHTAVVADTEDGQVILAVSRRVDDDQTPAEFAQKGWSFWPPRPRSRTDRGHYTHNHDFVTVDYVDEEGEDGQLMKGWYVSIGLLEEGCAAMPPKWADVYAARLTEAAALARHLDAIDAAGGPE